MTLSLNEAATLLGKSPRQVRYLIQQGRLNARKEGAEWRIEAADLPLTDAQRRAVTSRTEAVKKAMEGALAPAAAASEKAGKRRFSVRDLRAFQAGEPIYRDVAEALGSDDPAALRLREALDLLCQGCHSYRRRDKAALYSSARSRAASAVTELLLCGPASDERRRALADRVEQAFLSDLSGLIRLTERASLRDRFDRFGGSALPSE